MVHSSDLEFPVLIGDIGGTNARFQIIESKDTDPVSFDPVQTKQFDTPIEAIEQSVLNKTPLKPKSALLAAAGPISADGLDLTNCHWNIRPDEFVNLQSISNLILMNDFEAQALSLPLLKKEDGEVIGTQTISQSPQDTKAVLGPGTGLGVAILVRAQGKWTPVAGEGGHVDVGPRSSRETKVWEYLETIGGRISAEQIVCGNGLLNVYKACCAADGVDLDYKEPAEISAAAMKGDNPQAVEALGIFCTVLGRVAGDLALISGAKGGVYIAGGIAQKILPFLRESGFRAAFLDKAPHENLMESIVTTVVTQPLPALLGLSAYACAPETYALDIDQRSWKR